LADRLTTLQSLTKAFSSWRLAAVSLLSFSSGLPLGLILTAIPFWMDQEKIDIRSIGVITLAQAPYSFKFLWAPLMDRFAPRRGRKRLWIVIGQVMLAASVSGLALCTHRPTVGAIMVLALLISFSSSTQDIAIDAYSVEVLRKDEQGLAVGSRIALYRAAMYVGGAVVITIGPGIGWAVVFVALGLLFLLLVPVALLAPEPEVIPEPPRSLWAAIWEPFVGFFKHDSALQIASFIFLYKLADNVATALIRPFLSQQGFTAIDVGLAVGTIGLFATMAGSFVGGVLSDAWGLGRALWVFGILQALAGGGYAIVAQVGMNRPLMYLAVALEMCVVGLGTGAFNVLLLRLTQRRFSATQYALLSSIFALGRTVAGPPAGTMVDAFGWRDFFLLTIPMAIPGLIMLHRFVPWGTREIPPFEEQVGQPAADRAPVSIPRLLVRGAVGALITMFLAYLANSALAAMRALRLNPAAGFDLGGTLAHILHPQKATEYVDLFGPPVVGLVVGFGVAAYLAARYGILRARSPASTVNPHHQRPPHPPA